MWGDYMSKPLQGKLFQKFKKLIMGHWVSAKVLDDRSVLEELWEKAKRMHMVHVLNRVVPEVPEPMMRSDLGARRSDRSWPESFHEAGCRDAAPTSHSLLLTDEYLVHGMASHLLVLLPQH
jgi:hypothetical protein